MQDTIDKALSLILASEGGYVNDPHDPGGATKFGITISTLSRARGHPVTPADIATLTENEARSIYRLYYWNAVRGDELPRGLDYALLDAAVHSGPKQAVTWLQLCLKITADGVIGPMTLAAVQTANPEALIGELSDRRRDALQKLAGFARFGRGWDARVERVRRDSLQLVQNSASSPSLEPQKVNPMDQTQSIFQSRTVWSNIIGFGAFLLTLTGHGVAFDPGQVTDSIMQLVTAGSFVASTIFRVISTKKIAA
jgi:lysozyme family protein